MQYWETIPLIIYIIGVTIATCYSTLEQEIELHFWKILGRSLLWPLTLLWNIFKVMVIVIGFPTMLLFRIITGEFPQRVEKREQ